MKTIWLGQAGLLLETKNVKIMVDPYLSDSVEKINPLNYRRKEIDFSFFDIKPDVIILTHNHLDHTDPETLNVFLKKYSNITVLASKNAWETSRKIGGCNNYVMFNRHTVWSENGIKYTAVKAEHSDDYAIGVIIDDGSEVCYITGDTLYNSEIFSDIPSKIDILFLPVNGVGNNMNFTDALNFANKTRAEKVVPVHYGLFDEIDISKFNCSNKVVLTMYKEKEI